MLDHHMEDGVARGTVEFGNAFEGGPGLVHGGFAASLLDEALGMASIFSGNPGMTGELTVRYLRPTPLRQPLRLEARFDRREGRKIFCSGELYLADEPLVTSSGVFIAIEFEKFAEFHAQRAQSEGD
jgi:acyl-coenzyme A thioesterase PaaI-like protein